MNKKIIIIMSILATLIFTGCSAFDVPTTGIIAVNTNPTTNNNDSVYVTIGNSSLSVDIVTDEEKSNFLRVDSTTPSQKLLNHYFSDSTGINTTTSSTTPFNSLVINVTDGSIFTVGRFISIHNGTTHLHHYREILSKTATSLTIDAPTDLNIPIGSLIDEQIFNMAVDGSVTPISYKLETNPFDKSDITRMIIQFVLSGAPDDSKFGNIAPLTNGLVIRKNFNNTKYQTIAIWKTNKDIREDMYDLRDVAKAGGGNFALSGRWSFFKFETIISIDSSKGEFFEVLVQDDLTGLIDLQIKGQGHFDNE